MCALLSYQMADVQWINFFLWKNVYKELFEKPPGILPAVMIQVCVHAWVSKVWDSSLI